VSRIGRLPVPLPDGVTIAIDGNEVTVMGPKGELHRAFHPEITIEQAGNTLKVERPSDQRHHRALHGLTRALLSNMVIGVSEGYQKTLDIEGVGYRAEKVGDDLKMFLGYSHAIDVAPLPGIKFEVQERGRAIIVSGIDKELVGQVAANIRKLRPPEPYKGKGVRYRGEYVRRKAGKAGKVGLT
jgi:large subunit ribosomal protein L6